MANPIEAAINLANIMSVDSFITPSHFKKDQYRIVITPGYYDVSVLRGDDSEYITKWNTRWCRFLLGIRDKLYSTWNTFPFCYSFESILLQLDF